jgi:hypothetical protein
VGDDGIGREEAAEVRVVQAALQVDEAEVGIVLVPGEAERGCRRERRRTGASSRDGSGDRT